MKEYIEKLRSQVKDGTGKFIIEKYVCAFCRSVLGLLILDATKTVAWREEGACMHCVQKRISSNA